MPDENGRPRAGEAGILSWIEENEPAPPVTVIERKAGADFEVYRGRNCTRNAWYTVACADRTPAAQRKRERYTLYCVVYDARDGRAAIWHAARMYRESQKKGRKPAG